MDVKTLFDYDLWANKLWLESLEARGWPEVETKIFVHILGASTIWIERIGGESLSAIPTPEPTLAMLEQLHARWVKAVTEDDLDRVIAFKRTTGEANSLPIATIAQHVVNHGTYHRGELRGLAKAAGFDTFPETDFARFSLL